MRARFSEKEKAGSRQGGPVLTLVMFALVILALGYGLASLSVGNRNRQKETLERALNQAITYCYATEGHYPQSLQEIKENYGLTYDESLFYVDYQVAGANLYPDVTILEQS